ncbi:MAG TPA: GTP cyclohydrolase I, partial [Bacteroidales bacterium]|nr:GTP cyclohydrolase I [Bacteroidales bacterium]
MFENIEEGYERRDIYNKDNIEQLSQCYLSMIETIKEDPQREGLLKTPIRAAKAFQFLTHGYGLDPAAILKSAIFHEDSKQIVIV